jgi:hypothetical protein
MSEFPIPLDDMEGHPVAMLESGISLREWSGIINSADYFLGCDSVGQHIARALGTQSTVAFGSTFPINTSYLNDDMVDIIDVGQGNGRVYSPIRITQDDELDRLNNGVMMFSSNQEDIIIDSVRSRLGTPLIKENNADCGGYDSVCDKNLIDEKVEQKPLVIEKSGFNLLKEL